MYLGCNGFVHEIRPGVVVKFLNMPDILDPEEAAKLTRIVMAYVEPDQTENVAVEPDLLVRPAKRGMRLTDAERERRRERMKSLWRSGKMRKLMD